LSSIVTDAGVRGVLVIGVGNELRSDDGAGIEVARSLRARATAAGIAVDEEQGEPAALLQAWDGRDAVLLVDTARSGGEPGAVRRFDVSQEPLPAGLRGSSSTHAVGVSEAIELARALRRLPARVVVYAIAGATFEAGRGLSEPVEAAVPALADAVLAEATALASEAPP
jgi:hydrogenase maturation protease